jgi:ribonuclease HII
LLHEERLRASGAAERVAGIDEAGRGPLAGPVVAAAVILPHDFRHAHLDDSKKLSARKRTAIFDELTADPAVCWTCVAVNADEIDRLNILRATHSAMQQAVLALPVRPDHVLIDGRPVRGFPLPHTALVRGDGTSLSIAAASVIAKVTRDRLMDEFDVLYPGYGFARHKGYATGYHLAILARDGPCPIHRYSFQPVAQPLLAFAERSWPSAGPTS